MELIAYRIPVFWLDVSITSCMMIDYARGIVSEIRSGIKTIALRKNIHVRSVTNRWINWKDFFANNCERFKNIYFIFPIKSKNIICDILVYSQRMPIDLAIEGYR